MQWFETMSHRPLFELERQQLLRPLDDGSCIWCSCKRGALVQSKGQPVLEGVGAATCDTGWRVGIQPVVMHRDSERFGLQCGGGWEARVGGCQQGEWQGWVVHGERQLGTLVGSQPRMLA